MMMTYVIVDDKCWGPETETSFNTMKEAIDFLYPDYLSTKSALSWADDRYLSFLKSFITSRETFS